MRLLFLTETIPFPLDAGGRIKTYHTLRLLSRTHEVHCHALVRDRSHFTYERDLAPYCSHLRLHFVPRSWPRELFTLAWSQVAQTPFVVRRHFHRSVLNVLREQCQRHAFDGVYCDHLSMLEYGRRLGLPLILDAHNVEFSIIRRHAITLGWSPLRLPAELEWRRLRVYERRWYPRCRLVYCVSHADAGEIRHLAGPTPQIHVQPIAIDVAGAPMAMPLTRSPDILFVGGLHWPPNADAVTYFLERIFPAVRQAVPRARLTVVGKVAAGLFRRFGQMDGVRFEGHVADVEPYFRASRVMVVPLRSGSGMRVKILDALARGLPVVTTSIGYEGIEARAGVHLLAADLPAEFAAQVVRLLVDDTLASALAGAGRRLAQERYDVSAIADTLDRSMLHAFAKPPSPPQDGAREGARSPL